MSLPSASNWLFNFALGYATPYMIEKDKGNLESKVFFIWGSTCFGCLIFSIFSIWETKGLSLEQVNYLVRNSSPIKSIKLNKELKKGAIKGLEESGNRYKNIQDETSDGGNEQPNISMDMKDRNESIPRT